MKFVWFVAGRYLRAKKSHNVINIITWITICAIAVGTAGFIIVLSVFNGFGNLVLSLYDSFDSDIKVVPTQGKYFLIHDTIVAKIKQTEGVKYVFPIVEDNALLRYGDKQMVAKVKGVDLKYEQHSPMRHHMLDGQFRLHTSTHPCMVLGGGVAYGLSLRLYSTNNVLSVFYPDESANISDITNANAFRQMPIVPAGVFGLQQDFDNTYVFVPISFAREIFGKPHSITSIEVMLVPGTNAERVHNALTAILPSTQVQSRLQQHQFLFNILVSEKFVAYLILSLILLIATFSILGSLTLLIIEKRKDINVMCCMGCEMQQIRKIFFTEGMLITLTGAGLGMLIGFVICFLQQHFGIIKLGDGENFVTDSYPVAMMGSDFLCTFIIVVAIGFAASAYIAFKLLRNDKIEVHYLNAAMG